MTRIDEAVRYARRRARSIGAGNPIPEDPELEQIYAAAYAALNRSSSLTEEDVQLLERNGLSPEEAARHREDIRYRPGWLVRKNSAQEK